MPTLEVICWFFHTPKSLSNNDQFLHLKFCSAEKVTNDRFQKRLFTILNDHAHLLLDACYFMWSSIFLLIICFFQSLHLNYHIPIDIRFQILHILALKLLFCFSIHQFRFTTAKAYDSVTQLRFLLFSFLQLTLIMKKNTSEWSF